MWRLVSAWGVRFTSSVRVLRRCRNVMISLPALALGPSRPPPLPLKACRGALRTPTALTVALKGRLCALGGAYPRACAPPAACISVKLAMCYLFRSSF